MKTDILFKRYNKSINKKKTISFYSDGDKYWHCNGSLHREDGPAIEYGDGRKEWYLNGDEYS